MKHLQLNGLKFVTQELCLKLCILQKLFTLKLILFDFSYFIFLSHFYKPNLAYKFFFKFFFLNTSTASTLNTEQTI